MIVATKKETRLATLEWTEGSILIIRFRRSSSMDLEGVAEVVEQRRQMSEGRPILVLTVLPPDMDADIDVCVTDHAPSVCTLTLAEATVGATAPHRRRAELYYQHFPHPFPTGVFATEEEAVHWLRSHQKAIL